MLKTSQVLAGLTLALSVSAVAVTPAQAEIKQEEVLISQLRGHELYAPIQIYQDEWVKFKFEDNFVIGRVRGKAGDVLSIELLSPEPITINDREVTHVAVSGSPYYIQEGNDVILRYEDGKWVLLSDTMTVYEVKYDNAMPAWVTRLDLKEEVEVQKTSIDFSTPKPVSLPPERPSTVYEPTPTPEPVRGLW